jgi:type III pantothenate kinase
MMSGILVIDVGNTATTIGIAGTNRVTHVHSVPTPKTNSKSARVLIRELRRRRRLDGACIASVVPRRTGTWREAVARECSMQAFVVTHRVKMNITIDYPKPSTIGADRLAAACGAVTRHGAPVLVADFGTALTVDGVTSGGTYVGGVIVPGLSFMTDYLAEKTALLPRIKLRHDKRTIGRTTEQAMQAGARLGYRGMVQEIIREIRKDKRFRKATLCATGGHAAWAVRESSLPFRLESDLMLYGLAKIYELNRED